MSLQLSQVVDPRDNLGRASRDELWDFAKANGIAFDQRTATKAYMEKMLREKGLTHIKVAVRFQGRPTGDFYSEDGKVTTQPSRVSTVDADADMIRQMKEQAAQPNDRDDKPIADMTIGELRALCKRQGIKISPRDNRVALREKLSVQNAS